MALGLILTNVEKRVLYIDMISESSRYEELGELSSLPEGTALAFELYRRRGPKVFILSFSPAGFLLVFTSPASGSVYYSFSSSPLFESVYSKGISAVVISGVARKLSYVKLDGDHNEIRQCEQLRFSSVEEFSRIISDEGVLMAIGRAGERVSSSADILSSDGIELARGGAGAVMGAMNLKGIVIAGTAKGASAPHDTLPQLSKGIRYGWLPLRYFSGDSDPRLMHLEKPEDGRVATAASAMGIFSPERAMKFSSICQEEGLSLSETAEIIAYQRFYGELQNSDFDDIVEYVHQMGAGRRIPSREGMMLTGGHECLLDYRGALSLAVFATFSEGFMPYVELENGLSSRLSARNMGILSAYLRLYAHGSMALGFRSELLPSFKHIVNSAFLLRHSFLKMLKDRAFIETAFASINSYDSLRGKNYPVPEYFMDNAGFNVGNLRYSVLMEAYYLEMQRIQSFLQSKR